MVVEPNKYKEFQNQHINICQGQPFYCIRGYMFRSFKQSSSDLLTDRVNGRSVHVGIPTQ